MSSIRQALQSSQSNKTYETFKQTGSTNGATLRTSDTFSIVLRLFLGG